jgi:hypothetical protein
LVPWLLMNTEKPAVVVRLATVASRSISVSTSVNSVSSVVRLLAVVSPEAACVDSVARRSSSVEMFASAPSLICRPDSPSLALRMPWLMIATSLR